jgi:hypothetical protein
VGLGATTAAGGKANAAGERGTGNLADGLDTALHITALLHGLYVGAITTWLHWHGQTVGSHWYDQMLN